MSSPRYKVALMNYGHFFSTTHVQFRIRRSAESKDVMMDSSDSDLKHSWQEAHVVRTSEYMQIEILSNEMKIMVHNPSGSTLVATTNALRQIHHKHQRFSLYRCKVF